MSSEDTERGQRPAEAIVKRRVEFDPPLPPRWVLARHGARVLDPATAVAVADVKGVRPTAYVADRLLVPVQPRSFDVWAVERMAELVTEARALNERLEAFSVLNAADAQGRDNEEAAAALREVPSIAYLPGPVVRRKAFPNAAAVGRSVLEQSQGQRDPKAVGELEALARFVFV